MPDSLLSLKLNDLVKEPRLIQLFNKYLRDINGPTHLLDCFLQARDIHKRIHCLQVLLSFNYIILISNVINREIMMNINLF